jgi:hypothetical protein
MSDQHDFEPSVPPEERTRLVEIADRLERDRPLPRATFRGNLRRLLTGPQSHGIQRSGHWRVLVATYSGLGAFLLAVAGIGLAGAGPFGT